MQIKFDDKFEISFNLILEYTAQDKILASKKFRQDLFKQIKNLPNSPYKFRKSIYVTCSKIFKPKFCKK